jgi:hypothetical protein
MLSINSGYLGDKSCLLEMDTLVIKNMVLEDGARTVRVDGVRERRDRSCSGYRVISP